MIYIHETHHVIGGKMPAFLDSCQNEWKPLIEKSGTAHLLWMWLHVVGTGPGYRAISLLQVDDYKAWGAIVEQYLKRGSDLHRWYEKAWDHRRKVVAKTMVPVEWSPIPKTPPGGKVEHPATLYLHDVAFPYPGHVERYVDTLGKVYYPHLEKARHAAKIPVPPKGGAGMLTMELCLRVAPGSAEVHEVMLIQKIVNPDGFWHLIQRGGVPSPEKPPSAGGDPQNWMDAGLTVRDQWESQVFGTTTWSPLD